MIKVALAAALGIGATSLGLSATTVAVSHADYNDWPHVVCIGQHMYPEQFGYIDPSCNTRWVSDGEYNFIRWVNHQGGMPPWQWDMIHNRHHHDGYDN